MRSTKNILENGWYKTASAEEMRIALMHLEQEAIDTLFNQIHDRRLKVREDSFQRCAKDCGWGIYNESR